MGCSDPQLTALGAAGEAGESGVAGAAGDGSGTERVDQHEPAERPLVAEALPAPPEGTNFIAGIAACAQRVGRLDVFAVSTTGEIWNLPFDGSWKSWRAISAPGTADSPVSASTHGAHAQTIDLFYRDSASQLLGHQSLSPDDDAEWESELVGASPIPALAPTAASWAGDRIDVFTQGDGETLRHIIKDGAWEPDWLTVAGVTGVSSSPTVTAWGPNQLDVFWARLTPQGLQHWWFDGAAHPPTETVVDSMASAPVTTSRGSGLLDVVYLSGSKSTQLVRKYFNEAWRTEDYDLPDAQHVAVSSWGPGRVDLFYVDASGALLHSLFPSRAVLTQHNDVARTGYNDHEAELNVDNVASDDFGQLFTIPVDGNVYAQPLFQPTLDLTEQGQGVRNALYVATANDSVYLFDADTGEQLAQRSIGNSVPVPYGDFTTGGGNVPTGKTCDFNMLPQIGITSTPVLDPDNDTLYVVALTADEELEPEPIDLCALPRDPTHVYRVQLHALNSRTLEERRGSPVTVNPSYEYDGQTIEFQTNRQAQRPALLLSQGRVYLAFASYTDRRPYYGWVVTYDAATLKQKEVWVSTPELAGSATGGLGGIWQSGQGLAAAADGNVYFFTGNGARGANLPFANAAIELKADLSLVSAFRPYNAESLDRLDLDLSSSGASLVPDTNFVVGGGKEGIVYVLNRGNLGSASETEDDVVFEDLIAVPAPECVDETGSAVSNIHSGIVYGKSPSGDANLYLMGEGDFAKKLTLDPKTGKASVEAVSKERAACGMPGGFLSVSSNAGVPKTGIVWANVPTADAVSVIVPAKFYAFDAETLQVLYRDDSRALPAATSKFGKFVAPTIANGRVYQGAFGPSNPDFGAVNKDYSGSVVVYGLKPKHPAKGDDEG
ncbi:MAG: hypothetical protein ABW061_11055 [Polyangiaceae bacterium]